MRPTYCVVLGPAGTSVGKRMSPLWPVALTVCVPSELYVVFETDPFDRIDTDLPGTGFSESGPMLVYVKRKPLPAWMAFTRLPFRSVNVLRCRLPSDCWRRRAKPGQAVPAGRSKAIGSTGSGGLASA